MSLLLENNNRGGISSWMGDRFVKLDENRKTMYIDAINLYGWAGIESLHYDEIEMWHGHPNLYMKKLEQKMNTPDDSDFGYSLEVDLRCPENVKKHRKFHFVLQIKLFLKISRKNIWKR